MKLTIGIVATIIALTLLAMLGFKGCVKSIYKAQSCEWANIDNIELHAKIDVPPVVNTACNYSDSLQLKMAFFELKKKAFDANKYVALHGFERLSSFDDLGTFSFNNFKTDTLSLENLFVKQVAQHSISVLDAKNKMLWVRVDYKN